MICMLVIKSIKDSILFDTNDKNIYNKYTYYKEEELWNLVLA